WAAQRKAARGRKALRLSRQFRWAEIGMPEDLYRLAPALAPARGVQTWLCNRRTTNVHFCHHAAKKVCLRQNFRVHEGAIRLDRNPGEHRFPEYFEGTIDVAQAQSKDKAKHQPKAPVAQRPARAILLPDPNTGS